ncbi:MAG TPA: glycosyltransferase family 4 protein [Flavisolibacter sp.]|nr:glycosyltransferase family 4 protein [Flavisolibacter sp.]
MEGGTQLFILRLARGLIAQNVPVQVLLLEPSYENKTITSHFPEVTIIRRKNKTFKLSKKLDKLLFSLRSDYSFSEQTYKTWIRKFMEPGCIIHTNYIKTDHLIAQLKRKAPEFHHLVTVHGDYSAQYDHYKKFGRGIWNRMVNKMRLLKAQVDQWVVVSEEQRTFFLAEWQLPEQKIRKIYNGFEPLGKGMRLSLRNVKDENLFIIGMVARGVKEKGWNALLKAFETLPDTARLILVGEGDYLTQLQQSNTNNRITFTGFHPDPVSIMEQFDVLVLPTLFPFESLPSVIVEALYVGLPIIATRVGEIETMIQDAPSGKFAGFTIPYDGKSYDVALLSKYLRQLMMDKSMRQEMAVVAKRAFRKFNMGICIEKYRELYHRLSVPENVKSDL